HPRSGRVEARRPDITTAADHGGRCGDKPPLYVEEPPATLFLGKRAAGIALALDAVPGECRAHHSHFTVSCRYIDTGPSREAGSSILTSFISLAWK
ncbi:hypothetical protein MRX96_052380, partial [Rhipicephalus microplus]